MLETTKGNREGSSFEILKKNRANDVHINIKSNRNKFDLFSSMIKNTWFFFPVNEGGNPLHSDMIEIFMLQAFFKGNGY